MVRFFFGVGAPCAIDIVYHHALDEFISDMDHVHCVAESSQ